MFEKTHYSFNFEHFSQQGVSGIMVSIAAFQAVDPGSIPGWRSFFSFSVIILTFSCYFKKWKHIYQNYYHVNTWKIWTYRYPLYWQLPELYQTIEFYKTALLYSSIFLCLLWKLNQFGKKNEFFETKYGNVGI